MQKADSHICLNLYKKFKIQQNFDICIIIKIWKLSTCEEIFTAKKYSKCYVFFSFIIVFFSKKLLIISKNYGTEFALTIYYNKKYKFY